MIKREAIKNKEKLKKEAKATPAKKDAQRQINILAAVILFSSKDAPKTGAVK